MLEISPQVRRKAELNGAHDWLVALPDLISELEQRWSITLGRSLAGGTEAVVAEATRADGTPAVLKLLVPRGGMTDYEIIALRLADGDGMVRLFESDAEKHALLLERLGPPMFELNLPLEKRLGILCDLARRVWRPAAGQGLPDGAQKARSLAAYVVDEWERLGRPCAERTIDHAVACAGRRGAAHDDERARLLHGDVHQWNALRGADGFALVDPDGLLAEPEYDLGVIMREDPVELLRDGPRNRAATLAERTGCDPQAVWEWGVVERVSTGLVATSIDLQPVGAQMLEAADVIAVEDAG